MPVPVLLNFVLGFLLLVNLEGRDVVVLVLPVPDVVDWFCKD